MYQEEVESNLGESAEALWCTQLKTSEVSEALRNTFDNIDVGGHLEQFKTRVYTVAVDILGI